MSPHAKPEDLQTERNQLGEMGLMATAGHGPKKTVQSDGTCCVVEVRDYGHHTCYEIRSATERMLFKDMRTYNKYVSLDQRPVVFTR